MQPIRHEPEYLKGLEILTFDLVELEKIRGDGAHTFATLGSLSVFYFDYFERFILRLNNWKYCLLPRIPTTAVTNIGEIDSRNFVMPAYDGIYTLKVGQNFNPAALQNFVTILSNSTKFSREERQLNGSGLNPAELVRSQFITQPLNQPVSTYERPAELGFSSNYENIMQPTVNSGLDKSKKKGKFSKIKEKLRRKPKSNKKKAVNLNMTQARDFASIKATPESMVNTVEFKRTEIEEIIVSTKEILHRMESVPLTKTEEVKEKVIGIVDAIKEGVHDIKERIAERNEYEAQTGQHIGILQIVKEGVMEIRDRITHRGHLEEGELEPPEIEGGRLTATTKPGIIDTVKHSVHELKQRATVRHELAGEPGEVGIMDIVKEGYFEIKEKIANMRHEEPTTIVTEKFEPITYGGTPLKETRLGELTIHEPPAFYHSPRERLKIFDDKYLDQPLRAEPFPISGEAGKDMVLHYEEILRQTHNPESGVKYEEDHTTPSLFERIKAGFSSGKKNGPGVYEPKETQWPEGHAPGNISGKIKDILPGKPHVLAEPTFMDKIKMALKGPPDEKHSPVSKREYIKAAIPMLFKGAGHEEQEEAGQFGGLVRAGALVGAMSNEGLGGVTNNIITTLTRKDQEFRVYTPETAIQSLSIPEMKNVHPAPVYEQRNLETNLLSQHQPVTVVNPSVVQVSQVYQPSAYQTQSRVVEQRVGDSRTVNQQSQYSSVVTDRVYEVDLA